MGLTNIPSPSIHSIYICIYVYNIRKIVYKGGAGCQSDLYSNLVNPHPLYTFSGIYNMIRMSKKHIFEGRLAKNGQVTLKKQLRSLLQIETKDIVFLQVIKVETPEGEVKYKYDEEEKEE